MGASVPRFWVRCGVCRCPCVRARAGHCAVERESAAGALGRPFARWSCGRGRSLQGTRWGSPRALCVCQFLETTRLGRGLDAGTARELVSWEDFVVSSLPRSGAVEFCSSRTERRGRARLWLFWLGSSCVHLTGGWSSGQGRGTAKATGNSEENLQNSAVLTSLCGCPVN